MTFGNNNANEIVKVPLAPQISFAADSGGSFGFGSGNLSDFNGNPV